MTLLSVKAGERPGRANMLETKEDIIEVPPGRDHTEVKTYMET